jgi:hypothetical protein
MCGPLLRRSVLCLSVVVWCLLAPWSMCLGGACIESPNTFSPSRITSEQASLTPFHDHLMIEGCQMNEFQF